MSDLLPIDQVSVHPDGALVTRRGVATAVSGLITVRGLPLLLDEGSLRVELSGAELRSVRLELDLQGLDAGEDPEERVALLAAQHRVNLLSAQDQQLRNTRSSLDDLMPARPAKDDRGPPPVERVRQWREARAAIDAWAEDIDNKVIELAAALRKAREDLRIAQHRLESHSTEALMRRWLPSRRALIEVEQDGPVTVALSYRSFGAVWTPAYTLHTDAALTRGRFTVRALVAQASGEDWNGVSLALCTAPAARAVDLPELPSLRLGSRQPPRRSGWRPLPADLDSLFPPNMPVAPAAPPLPEPVPMQPLDLDEDSEDQDTGSRLEELSQLFYSADSDESASGAYPASPPPPAPMAPQPMRSGGPPPPPTNMMPMAPGAPPPSPMRQAPPLAAKSASRSRSFFGGSEGAGAPLGAAAPQAFGGGGGSVPEPPAPPEPIPDGLDYDRLRLAPPGAPSGQRGRLRRAAFGEEVLERGLPHEALTRLNEAVSKAMQAITQVSRIQLPPHHVKAGPVDGVDFRYEANGRVDIPSDGGPRALIVRGEDAEMSVRYRAVPREDARVYRSALVSLQDRGTPFLAGPVDLYIDGSLALSMGWSGSPGGGKLRIDLGVEDGLKVVRNVHYSEESAGLLRGSRRLITDVDVQVASSLSRPVQVELLERMPVAGDDQITVELAQAEPAAQEYKGEIEGVILKGGRRQVLSLAAGALGKATLRYTVTLASGLELQGGDRRG